MRPPGRSVASRTRQGIRNCLSRYAQARPEIPAPTTSTFSLYPTATIAYQKRIEDPELDEISALPRIDVQACPWSHSLVSSKTMQLMAVRLPCGSGAGIAWKAWSYGRIAAEANRVARELEVSRDRKRRCGSAVGREFRLSGSLRFLDACFAALLWCRLIMLRRWSLRPGWRREVNAKLIFRSSHTTRLRRRAFPFIGIASCGDRAGTILLHTLRHTFRVKTHWRLFLPPEQRRNLAG